MYKFTFTAPPNIPQEIIDEKLTSLFLEEIKGVRTFNDKRIVLYVNFDKRKDEFSTHIEQYTHTLEVEIANVLTKDFTEYNPRPFQVDTKNYTRWERFKQFVKGE